MRELPPSDYAITALVRGEPGSLPRVLGLTALRTLVLGAGMYAAGLRGKQLARGAVGGSVAVTLWVAAMMVVDPPQKD